MSGSDFDVRVIGLGVMGSAAAYHLARRGLRVLGQEQFGPAHDRGSSHGLSRVIRQAYFEHPDYVPLVLRAYELWENLERESGRSLLRKTGALMIGRPECAVVQGSRKSAELHRLRHRMMSAEEVRSRFPVLRLRDDEVALEEFDAGVLQAEESVRAMQELAARHGAELQFGVQARLDERRAPKTVVTAGGWIRDLVPGLPLQGERQVLHWFDPQGDESRIPLYLWDRDGRPFYAIPDVHRHGLGMKVAFHHHGETASPHDLRRDVEPAEIEEMRRRLSETVPSQAGAHRKSAVCLYTNTPDEHFLLGALPGNADLVLASPCSGHGFKFAPVMGEILADLVQQGRTRHPVGLFSPDRFGGGLAKVGGGS
ncbi:MAG TPA: N-methyl-L-tryptophan oxidase [Planctomycetota bacterium]|nr:N-methyl-L-tryptophan oxidase [Planctomycetota bacterium]